MRTGRDRTGVRPSRRPGSPDGLRLVEPPAGPLVQERRSAAVVTRVALPIPLRCTRSLTTVGIDHRVAGVRAGHQRSAGVRGTGEAEKMLKNVKTDETPQALKSGGVADILISNEVVGASKLARAGAKLHRRRTSHPRPRGPVLRSESIQLSES